MKKRVRRIEEGEISPTILLQPIFYFKMVAV